MAGKKGMGNEGSLQQGKPRPSETHRRSCCVKGATLEGSSGFKLPEKE